MGVENRTFPRARRGKRKAGVCVNNKGQQVLYRKVEAKPRSSPASTLGWSWPGTHLDISPHHHTRYLSAMMVVSCRRRLSLFSVMGLYGSWRQGCQGCTSHYFSTRQRTSNGVQPVARPRPLVPCRSPIINPELNQRRPVPRQWPLVPSPVVEKFP